MVTKKEYFYNILKDCMKNMQVYKNNLEIIDYVALDKSNPTIQILLPNAHNDFNDGKTDDEGMNSRTFKGTQNFKIGYYEPIKKDSKQSKNMREEQAYIYESLCSSLRIKMSPLGFDYINPQTNVKEYNVDVWNIKVIDEDMSIPNPEMDVIWITLTGIIEFRQISHLKII